MEVAGRVADTFAERVRALEESTLSPRAVRSYETLGRELEEEPCRVRTPFQRDRDRIVHSKPFRRLKGKTQVFIDPEGDHYRTRMTHALETTAISRVVARALRLNEDLVEAIGLGHDLGHPPFGHIGEDVLDACVHERFGRRFRHYEHSLRVVDVLQADAVWLPPGVCVGPPPPGRIVDREQRRRPLLRAQHRDEALCGVAEATGVDTFVRELEEPRCRRAVGRHSDERQLGVLRDRRKRVTRGELADS